MEKLDISNRQSLQQADLDTAAAHPTFSDELLAAHASVRMRQFDESGVSRVP